MSPREIHPLGESPTVGSALDEPAARAADARRHAAADPPEVRILTGRDVLARIARELDELHAVTGAPVTARRPWLEAWMESHPALEPVAVLVGSTGGRLEGAALLARRRHRLVTAYVALGAGLSDQVRLPARNPVAAHRLADAVVALLRASAPWSLVIRHLPARDPVVERIAAELGCATLATGDASPTLRFGPERTLRAYVSKNHHKQVRRMLNRMQTEGLMPVVAHLRAPAAIAEVMPEIVKVCVARDLALRGLSLLDRSSARTFFHLVVRAHAERGEVELTTLRIRGALAAYVLCFIDQGVYRMWNCRLAQEWERYGAGRVANNAALERALADERATEFDWMRGAEPYKFSMCNHVEHALDLRAWSTPALRLLDSPRALKGLVKGVVAEHGWLQPAFDTARRIKSAGRRGGRAFVQALRGPRA